jgi:DNA-binding transcriptional MerR regulator
MENEKKEIPKLYVHDVARCAGCCNQTVINLEKRGFVKPLRDKNGFRRFTEAQAIRVKEIFNMRTPV